MKISLVVCPILKDIERLLQLQYNLKLYPELLKVRIFDRFRYRFENFII